MRDFRLYELADERFEAVIGALCRCELGTGTVVFSKGRDGGRDGRFNGTAERYPSTAAPWSGPFIIQAKHTNNPIASCSDPDFETNQTGVIATEIPRIRRLRTSGELDNYLLFTNRKLSGDTEARICKRIRNECSVPNVALLGVETLSRMLALHMREITPIVPELNSSLGPLRFFPQDLATVLDAMTGSGIGAQTSAKDNDGIQFVTLADKNELNNLGERYFQYLQAESSPYFNQIKIFLSDPRNETLAVKYGNIVADLNHRVIVRRDDFARFDAVFETIYDVLLEHDPSLRNRARLVLTLLHYMYWNCDLGEKLRAPSNPAS